MKKIYLTLGLGALILGANAQQKVTKTMTAHVAENAMPVNNTAAKAVATTTLNPSTFNTGGCALTSGNIVYYSITQYTATPSYTVDAKGFLFGTNLTYQTQGATTYTIVNTRAAQKYTVAGTATISSVIVGSAKHASDNATTMISAKIYSENATTKAPSTAVGTAATKALNSFTGNDVLTFGTPVVVPAGNFFASIESGPIGGATHDTLAILSTKFGCSSTDSLSWQYQTAVGLGGVWSSVVSGGTSADNLDLVIFVVADIAPSTTGINSISRGNLTLLAAYPNPAANEVNINFGLNQSSKVEVSIYDVAGKLISTTKLDELEEGNHTTKLDVSSLNSGVYMYSVKSNGSQLFSKFTVAK